MLINTNYNRRRAVATVRSPRPSEGPSPPGFPVGAEAPSAAEQMIDGNIAAVSHGGQHVLTPTVSAAAA